MMTNGSPDPLTAALRRLPEPAAPESVEANVMARIARMPVPAPDPALDPARRRRDAFAWVRAAAGLVLSLGCAADLLTTGVMTPRSAAPWAVLRGLDLASSPAIAALLALGLLMTAAGLFGLGGMAPGGRLSRRWSG